MMSEAEIIDKAIQFNNDYYRQKFEEPIEIDGILRSPYENPSGTHHNFLLERCLKLARDGARQEQLAPLVYEYCEKTGHDIKDGMNILIWVYGLKNLSSNSVKNGRTLSRLDAFDILAQPAPKINWIVEDLFPQGMSILLYGDGGEGKSTLAYAIGVDVCKGNRCFAPPQYKNVDTAIIGRKTTKSRVVYFDLEEGGSTIHHRLEKLNKALPKPIEPREFIILTDIFDLTKEEDQRLVRNELKELSSDGMPLLVVFDSFIRCCGSTNEDKAAEVAPVTNFLTQKLAHEDGHTVLLLHHKNKQGLLRGSLELKNGVDIAIELKAPKTVNNSERQLVKDKSRMDILLPITFKRVMLNDGSFWFEEMVPLSVEEEKRTRLEDRELAILDLCDREDNVTWIKIRKRFANEKLTREALDSLVKKGFLEERKEKNAIIYKRVLDDI